MKKLILPIILFILCLSFQASAFNPMIVVSGSGEEVTCSDCSGDVMFANFWEIATTTTSIETGNPCGCSDNATKTGTEQFGASAISIAESDCTGTKTLLNGDGSRVTYPLTMVGYEGKITLNFMISTGEWEDNKSIFNWWDADDGSYTDKAQILLTGAADDIELIYEVAYNNTLASITTVGFDGVEDQWYQIVIEFKQAAAAKDMSLTTYTLNESTCATSNELVSNPDKALGNWENTPHTLYFGGKSVVMYTGNVLIEGTSGL